MLKQILERQGSEKKEISEIKACYVDLNSKVEGLAIHVKGLENQITQVASTSRNNGKGILPGKPEQNPKEYCNAITLRSGKELPTRVSRLVEVVVNGKAKTLDLEAKESEDVNNGKVVVNEEEEQQVVEKDASKKNDEFIPPPYEPKLPFPGRFKKEILDKQYEKFKAIMKKVQVTLPFMDLMKDCPIYHKLLKDVMMKKRIFEESMGIEYHECSAILQDNLPKKLQDPGSFTLPCSIGSMSFEKCLVDLGASVSIMPLTVSKKLGLTDFKKTRISLVLADRSIRYPIGVLENLPLKVGNYIIPTDFVVLDMDVEAKDPIILGRPFLATSGAHIDVKQGIITLHVDSSVLKFDIMDPMKRPNIDGKIFHVEILDKMEAKAASRIESASNGKTSHGEYKFEVKDLFDPCKDFNEEVALMKSEKMMDPKSGGNKPKEEAKKGIKGIGLLSGCFPRLSKRKNTLFLKPFLKGKAMTNPLLIDKGLTITTRMVNKNQRIGFAKWEPLFDGASHPLTA